MPYGPLVSSNTVFIHPDEIGDLPTHHTQQLRIRHFLEHRESPYLG
ncbi:hypothetical protein [Streptomyces platensis]